MRSTRAKKSRNSPRKTRTKPTRRAIAASLPAGNNRARTLHKLCSERHRLRSCDRFRHGRPAQPVPPPGCARAGRRDGRGQRRQLRVQPGHGVPARPGGLRRPGRPARPGAGGQRPRAGPPGGGGQADRPRRRVGLAGGAVAGRAGRARAGPAQRGGRARAGAVPALGFGRAPALAGPRPGPDPAALRRPGPPPGPGAVRRPGRRHGRRGRGQAGHRPGARGGRPRRQRRHGRRGRRRHPRRPGRPPPRRPRALGDGGAGCRRAGFRRAGGCGPGGCGQPATAFRGVGYPPGWGPTTGGRGCGAPGGCGCRAPGGWGCGAPRRRVAAGGRDRHHRAARVVPAGQSGCAAGQALSGPGGGRAVCAGGGGGQDRLLGAAVRGHRRVPAAGRGGRPAAAGGWISADDRRVRRAPGGGAGRGLAGRAGRAGAGRRLCGAGAAAAAVRRPRDRAGAGAAAAVRGHRHPRPAHGAGGGGRPGRRGRPGRGPPARQRRRGRRRRPGRGGDAGRRRLVAAAAAAHPPLAPGGGMSSDLVRVEHPESPAQAGGFLRRPTLTGEAVAYLALGLLVGTAVMGTSQGWFTPDTKPEVYLAPVRTLARTLSTWDPDPHLGQPNFQTGLLPVSLAVSAIDALGLPSWLVVRVWRTLLLLVAGWGAVRLFHDLAGERSSAAGRVAAGRVAAAAVYVANPYVVVAGATTPVLVPYALLPWLLLALARAVRDPGSWRWPAAFALVFFLMTGMNAGVVALFMCLAVPCYLLYVRLTERARWSRLLGPALRCAVLALVVSLYWLVPAVMAGETGEAVAAFTERPESVASTSSYAEVLRLLGFWVMYFQQDGRLAMPGSAVYLTSPLALVAGFLLPALAAAGALLSRARARALAVLLLAVAVPVIVGLFPPSSPSPFGRLLSAAFERVPGAIAFRTTNKAGALVALAYALLLGLGAVELLRRGDEGERRWRGIVTAAVAVVLDLAVLPAWTGGLYPIRYQVPGYWRELAADVNSGPDSTRVLLAPGASNTAYRWGMEGPDDVNLSLLSRPSVVRTTVPNGSFEQTNFLAAMDLPLSTGDPDPEVVAAMARYLGVAEVVVRNDQRWEAFGGPRPSVVAKALAGDPSLRPAAAYGNPGQNTVAPVSDFYPPDQAAQDAAVPPLQRYTVAGARPVVRTEATRGALLVDGDNFAIGSLVRLGLAGGEPAFRLLGSVTPAELAASVASGARVVVTDSNRRRAWGSFRTGQNYSPTLRADQPLGPSTLALFDDPGAMTVTRLEGAASVTATGSGSLLTATPFGKPEFAFDGDRRTAWTTGDFGGAVGQSITVALQRPAEVGSVVLRPVLSEPGVQVAGVRVRVDAGAIEVPVPAEPEVRVDVPDATTSSVTVEITKVRGVGLNPVGFWEIGVPGVEVRQVARVPQTLRRLAGALSPADRARLDAAPIDVVLTRAAGEAGDRFHDEERVLDRELWLPAARDFTVHGLAAAGPGLPDPVVDRLAGASGRVVASSSSRFFDEVGARASQALDGDPDSAWVPDGRGPGEWIELRLPGERLDHVDVLQTVPKGLVGVDAITAAEVSVNGGEPFLVNLKQGKSRVGFPAAKVRRLRLTIDRVAGLGGQVRISELRAGRARIPAAPRSRRLRDCVELATVDGDPLRVRLDGTVGDLAAGESLPLRGCR